MDKQTLLSDLQKNYDEMKKFGIRKDDARYFMPPFEWYNDTVSSWVAEAGLQIINFTPGTRTNADYTTPVMPNYRSSGEIYRSVVDYERIHPGGLNGFILLVHIGTDPARTDKFYRRLPELIRELQSKNYVFRTVDQLLSP